MNKKFIIVLITYLVISILLQLYFYNDVYLLIINPLIWLIFATESYKIYGLGKNNHLKKDINKIIIIIILIYLILVFASGLFFDYVKSPYSHTFLNTIKNIWIYIIVIIFKEIVRYILINKNRSIILITIVFILFDINFYNIYMNFIDSETLFKYLFTIIIPIIVENILFTYIAIVGNFISIICYRIPINLYNILLPIFPNINWFLSSSINIILVVVVYIAIKYFYFKKVLRISKRNIKQEKPTVNIIIIIILIIFICFIYGLFRIKPISIASNSMYPLIKKGDVVIVDRIDNNNFAKLKIGDIIEYQKDNIIIVHRIVKIDKNNEQSFFITKGDNNKSNDIKEVSIKQIKGRVIFKVPKIGYPSIWLNELFKKNNRK